MGTNNAPHSTIYKTHDDDDDDAWCGVIQFLCNISIGLTGLPMRAGDGVGDGSPRLCAVHPITIGII